MDPKNEWGEVVDARLADFFRLEGRCLEHTMMLNIVNNQVYQNCDKINHIKNLEMVILSCCSSKPGPQSMDLEEVRGAGERGENSW